MSINVTSDKNTIMIEIPLEKPWLSQSGKSLLVASTHGTKMTDVRYKGRNVSILLNAFIRPTDKEVEAHQKKEPKKTKKSRK